MKTITLFLIGIFIFQVNLQAQVTREDRISAIKNEFTDNELGQYEAAEEKIHLADVLIKEVKTYDLRIDKFIEKANQASKKRDKKKALKEAEKISKPANDKRIEATELYTKYMDKHYLIYKNKINQFSIENVQEKEQIDLLQEAAKQKFVAAKKLLLELRKKDTYMLIRQKTDTIYALRLAGLEKLEEALCIIYRCNEPEEIVEVVKKEPEINMDSIEINSTPVIEEAIEGAIDVITKPDITEEKPEIIFKIQIIAVSGPLTQGEVERLLGKNIKITVEHNAGLWKYLIDEFDNYHDAKNKCAKLPISDAFLVPYENGKRTTMNAILKYLPDEVKE